MTVDDPPRLTNNEFRIYCRSTTGVVELYQPGEEPSQKIVVLADSSMLTRSLPTDTIRDLPVSPGTTWTGRTRRDPDPQKRSIWKPSVEKSLIRLAMWAVVLGRIVSNGPGELHYVVSSALQNHPITVTLTLPRH
ncbi:hypothetical protein GEV33_002005 [Tenebrio molitor]|uniref:Uncharacterized protein n=1 Tax=Tenebrio molitor TaxID=7067 RepID=A0A8J6HS87_TENMO|nr:hypothetical protein GEV33_002005 [Tenebrio molitor]